MRTRFVLGVLAAAMTALTPVAARADQPVPPTSEYVQPTEFASTPGGEVKRPGMKAIPSTAAKSTKSKSDCAREATEARSRGVAAVTYCTSIDRDLTPEPLTKEQRETIAAAVAECSQSSTPNTGWWATSRRNACSHQQFDLIVTRVPDGVVAESTGLPQRWRR